MRGRRPTGTQPRNGARISIAGINYAPEVTGIGPYTAALAAGLARRGHHVVALTGLPHYPQWSVVDERYRTGRVFREDVDGVAVHRLRHHVPRVSRVVTRLRMEVSFTLAVLRHGLQRPDLLVTVSPPLITSAALVACARLRRIPVGVIVQDVYSRGVRETGSMSGAPARLLGRVEAFTVRAATGVVVIHERFAAGLEAIGVEPSRITVIRNWTHVVAPAEIDRHSVRTRHGWRDDELVVVHSGNIGMKQGLENVVAAAKLADDRGAPIRFVLLGDGNQRRSIEQLAEGVSSIQFLRPLPEAEFMETLAAADVLLVNESPGVAEMAAPSKLTSYFATGRPVLAATDPTGVTADEIRASGAGVLVSAGQPDQLLDAALDLAHDASVTDRLGRSGCRYSGTALDAESALDRYGDWCDRLLTGREP